MTIDTVGTYKPGSVIRIRLQNFLTYSEVEFRPGPRLNLVCGPNGTGKSTILNAMCLGLGGEPKMLGRADDSREFISHGKERALIEIEVQPFPGKPKHIFRRKIERDKGSARGRGRGASTFYLNNEQTTAKEIQKVVSGQYHISVDNLCTFLPQDRVGSFSSFNSKQLLEETEKSLSASQHLFQTHEKLIQLERRINEGGNETETLVKKLKSLETDFENIKREKERMEERQNALQQIELLKKKILWLKYDEQREKCLELKQNKDAAKKSLSEAKKTLIPLEQSSAEYQTNVERLKSRFKQMNDEAKSFKMQCKKQSEKFQKHTQDLDEDVITLQTIEEEARKAERLLSEGEKELKQLEESLQRQQSAEEIKTELKEADQESRAAIAPLRGKKREYERLHSSLRQASESRRVHQNALNKINDEKAARRNQVFTRFPNLKRVADFVKENQAKFRRPVWGPVACEIETKTKNAACYLEQHVPSHVFKGFVVECKEDWKDLYQMVRNGLKLPINILTVPEGRLENIERMYSEKKYKILRQDHGVVGYLDESFTAPDPIMQALRNEGMVHKVLVGNDKTQESLDKRNLLDYLSQSEDGSSRQRACCIFSSHGNKSYKYTSSVSRYSKSTSLRVDDVHPARFLIAGVDDSRKRSAEAEVEKAMNDESELKNQIEDNQKELDNAVMIHQEAKARYDAIKNKYDAAMKLKSKVSRQRKKVENLQERVSTDNTAEKQKLVKHIKNRIKFTISTLEEHAKGHRSLLEVTTKCAGIRINEALAGVEFGAIMEQLQEARREFTRLEVAERKAKEELSQAKSVMNATLNKCISLAPLKDDNGDPLPLKAELEALPVDTVDEAAAALEEAEVKANTIDDNPDVVVQYDKLKSEILATKDSLENLESTKEGRLQEIRNMQEPWEAALENSIHKINTLFGSYMSELGCAGEIVLKRGNNQNAVNHSNEHSNAKFDQWGVEIQVKFREKSKMSVLSAHRHSGGERSVSTIMYLMSLQELMVSPFRCVDEINQGLDERNERLVFKRIVQNSTRPPKKDNPSSHSGQYFLITPKLLPNLTDMEEEGVTVHIITNGAFTFDNPKDWNPDSFVEQRKHMLETLEKNDSDTVNNNSEEGSSRKRLRTS